MPQETLSMLVDDFACPCCGTVYVDPRLIVGLDCLSYMLGKDVILESVYRCEFWNTAVGGAEHSQHLLGKAADIKVLGMTPQQIKEVAEKIPVFRDGGIGLYEKHLHVDVRDTKARWDKRPAGAENNTDPVSA